MTAAVKPSHIVYAVEETGDDPTLLGLYVPAYGRVDGYGVEGLVMTPVDWSRVNLVVHGRPPHGAPVLTDPQSDPTRPQSWVLPDIGAEHWDRHTEEWATVEDADTARRKWHRLRLRAAFLERYLDPEKGHADLVAEAVRRADRLGWRSVSTARLVALLRGDDTRLPPDA